MLVWKEWIAPQFEVEMNAENIQALTLFTCLDICLTGSGGLQSYAK